MGKLIELAKRLLRRATLLEIMREELDSAHLEKLKAETAVDYARSVVIYNEQRVSRLNERISEYIHWRGE